MEKRYAVIAGAAGGIGGACARLLAADGWDVIGLDVKDGAPEPVDGGGSFTLQRCDLSDASAVEQAFAGIARRVPRLHALLCCQGILRVGPLEAMSVADFDAIFAVNLRGPWLCARAAAPLLVAAATAEYPSRLVFLSSVAAFRPKLNGGAYAATKAGLETVARAMAGELAPRGVLVNVVAPGPVDTPFVQQAASPAPAGGGGGSYKPGGQSPIPRGRIATAREVAGLMRFLLSNEANNLVGAVLATDGGVSAVRA